MPVRRLLPFCVLAATLLVAGGADATHIGHRTVRISEGGGGGSSLRPVISDSGGWVVFDSNVPLLTSRVNADRDVFIRRATGGRVRLVSHTMDGAAPDGSSIAPAVSTDGRVVAFESDATNMVADDTNLASDVFVETGARVYPISTTPDGKLGNGDSASADLSADGQMIVFQSTASDLVGDDANGVSDIFARNLVTGEMTRVSQSESGFGGDGPSRAPSISPDGRYVTFASSADNLVPGDSEGLPDVFLADLKTGRMRMVSVNSHEQEQDRAVRSPFVQISDVSRKGRFVVFDSDATNLEPSDRRLHTDIFLRDVKKGTTKRVSRSNRGEANSDSVYPRVSPDGRYVTFESFANNLFREDAAGPDSFLYDRYTNANTLLDVTNSGNTGGSHSRQILQRPSVSADGNTAAFTARHALVGADANGAADVYTRRVDPAAARIRIRHGRYRLRADDPHADTFLCHLRKLVGICPKAGSLSFLPRGRYKLTVSAFGAGIRLGPPATKRFRRK